MPIAWLQGPAMPWSFCRCLLVKSASPLLKWGSQFAGAMLLAASTCRTTESCFSWCSFVTSTNFQKQSKAYHLWTTKDLKLGVWDLWPMLSAFSLKPRRCRRRQRSKLQPRKDRKETETREEEKEGIGQQCPTLRTERVSYVWWLGYEWCGSVRLARLVAGLCMDPEVNVVGQLKSMLAQHLAEEF